MAPCGPLYSDETPIKARVLCIWVLFFDGVSFSSCLDGLTWLRGLVIIRPDGAAFGQ